MKKLTKKEMARNILIFSEESGSFNELIKLSWDELDTKLAALKIINQPKRKEKKMSKFAMEENFVVGAKELVHGKLGKQTKEAPAVKEIKAVKAIEAVEAVKAIKANKKKDIEAVAAVKAVKAVVGVKGVVAKEATLQTSEIYIKCTSKEIAKECCARVEDQGCEINNGGMIFEEDEFHCFSFTTIAPEGSAPGTAMKLWRAIVNKCKNRAGYNAPGLVLVAAAKKEEGKEKAKAKRAEEKAKAKIKESDTPKETPGDEKGEWPGSFDEE